MKRNRYTTKEIEDEVRSYYADAVKAVEVPPVPQIPKEYSAPRESSIQAAADKREDRGNDAPLTFRFALPRVAAALLLIAFGTFFFIRPVTPNHLAEIIGSIAVEKSLDEKIVSGLQRAGHFLSDTLENQEQGVRQ